MTGPSAVRFGATGQDGEFGPWPAGGTATPEFRLLAACCRWPPSASRNGVIRDAANHLGDWDRFLWLTNRHRVAGLVYAALSTAPVELPAAASAVLNARAQNIARRNLLMSAETARLQRTFDAAGIPCLALKGTALAQLAYGSLNAKDTRDIDLLVPPERIESALAILRREGYTLSYPAAELSEAQARAVFRYGREVQLLHPEKGLLVELQWRLGKNPLLLTDLDAYSPTQNVAISDGASIRTLAPAPLFAYLCVHGAQHAWSRLKWLADLNALAAADGSDLLGLFRYAQSVGAGRCAGQALLLCTRLFDLILPHVLSEEFNRDPILHRLAGIAIETMCNEYAEADRRQSFGDSTRVVFSQFLLGKGWAFLAAQYSAEAVRTLDLVALPLPPTLHFLYPVLRLPLWLWRRAKAATLSTIKSARALVPSANHFWPH